MIGRLMCAVRWHRYVTRHERDGNGTYAVCRRCGHEGDFGGIHGLPG